jgi:hypothetical protein
MKSAPGFALGLILLLAACNPGSGASPAPSVSGTPEPDASPSASPAPTLSGTPSPSPIGNSAVALVRIEWTGGFIAPQMTLQRYPTVVMYADGKVVTQGPQIMVYPGPALPSLLVTQLSQHGVDQVLQWAAEAGLQGEDRMLGRPIPDVGVTVFTVVTAEGTHTTSVADLSGNDPDTAAVRQFQDVMLNLRSWLADDIAGDDVSYRYDRLRVISWPADGNSIPDPALSTTRDWPLASLATLGQPMNIGDGYRCAPITGDDLATLRPMVEEANQLTLWKSDDQLYQLILHPLLPDEEDCPVS